MKVRSAVSSLFIVAESRKKTMYRGEVLVVVIAHECGGRKRWEREVARKAEDRFRKFGAPRRCLAR